MRGYIVDKRWEYVCDPPDVGEIKPSKSGYIKFSKAGIYTFEYKCNLPLSRQAGFILHFDSIFLI